MSEDEAQDAEPSRRLWVLLAILFIGTAIAVPFDSSHPGRSEMLLAISVLVPFSAACALFRKRPVIRAKSLVTAAERVVALGVVLNAIGAAIDFHRLQLLAAIITSIGFGVGAAGWLALWGLRPRRVYANRK